jgi:CBS domain-containing protein
MLNVSLENIMSEQPIKVKEDVRLGSVSHLLLRYRINGVLVVKNGDENGLVGIFTTTDLLNLVDKALAKKHQRIAELKKVAMLPIGQVASRNIISLQTTDTVAKAVAVMHRKKVHTIPIFDKGRLVGVIGKHDILNMALA